MWPSFVLSAIWTRFWRPRVPLTLRPPNTGLEVLIKLYSALTEEWKRLKQSFKHHYRSEILFHNSLTKQSVIVALIINSLKPHNLSNRYPLSYCAVQILVWKTVTTRNDWTIRFNTYNWERTISNLLTLVEIKMHCAHSHYNYTN